MPCACARAGMPVNHPAASAKERIVLRDEERIMVKG